MHTWCLRLFLEHAAVHLWCVYDVRTTPAGVCVCAARLVRADTVKFWLNWNPPAQAATREAAVCCRTGLQVLMRLFQPMLLREADYLHPRLPSNKTHLHYSPIPYWPGWEETRVSSL